MSDEFRDGLLAQDENSILDIKAFFEKDAAPLKDNEFKEFWMSLTPEERDEFKKSPLK
jgi:hypothetical protein